MWMEQVLLPAVEFFWRSRPVARVDILEDAAEATAPRARAPATADPSAAASILPTSAPTPPGMEILGMGMGPGTTGPPPSSAAAIAPQVLVPGVPPVPAAPPGVLRAVGDLGEVARTPARIAAAPVPPPADPAAAEATLPEASLDMVASIREQQIRHDEAMEAMRRRAADADAAANAANAAANAAANGGAALSMHDQILVAADQRRASRRRADETAAADDRDRGLGLGLGLGLGMEATVQRQAAVEEGDAELPQPVSPSVGVDAETRASAAASSGVASRLVASAAEEEPFGFAPTVKPTAESLRGHMFEAPSGDGADTDALTLPLRNIHNLAPNAGAGAAGGEITSPVDLLF